MNTCSISQVIASAKTTNNGRLNSMAMTAAQIAAAKAAVSQGLMSTYQMKFPGYGFVSVFQLRAA